MDKQPRHRSQNSESRFPARSGGVPPSCSILVTCLLDLGHGGPVQRVVRRAPADQLGDPYVQIWRQLQLRLARQTGVKELHLVLGVDPAPELVARGAADRQQQHPEAADKGEEEEASERRLLQGRRLRKTKK